MLGVDSVTDILVVVGSDSSGLMGEGPGKDSAVDLVDLAVDGRR